MRSSGPLATIRAAVPEIQTIRLSPVGKSKTNPVLVGCSCLMYICVKTVPEMLVIHANQGNLHHNEKTPTNDSKTIH